MQALVDEIEIEDAICAQRTPAPPVDMQAVLDAIENDEIWADEAPLFLRSPTE